VIKQHAHSLLEAAAEGNVEPLLAALDLSTFSVGKHLETMTQMARVCRAAGMLQYLQCLSGATFFL
jgi:hypothetical protein